MLTERTIKILNDNDMTIYDRFKQGDEFVREVEFYSPEGEDVCEAIFYDGTDEGFIAAFAENARDFDADEHAKLWIENRNTVPGVPQNIQVLIQDAKAIRNKLLNVTELLNNQNIDTYMDKQQFKDYINDNFSISGEAKRLISSILDYVEEQHMDICEQHTALIQLLDGIGLEEEEIVKVLL